MKKRTTILSIIALCLIFTNIVYYSYLFKPYSTEELYKKESKAVVEILALPPEEKTSVHGGTGFFISSDGFIVTAAHVIYYQDIDELSAGVLVTSDEKVFYSARIIKVDLQHDIAILKVNKKLIASPKSLEKISLKEGQIPAEKFPYLNLKFNAKFTGGEKICTIGYPGTFFLIITDGIITSSMLQDVPLKKDNVTFKGVVVTNLFIYPGNSGGPIFDMYGNVIGVATLGNLEAPISFFQKVQYIENLINDKSNNVIVSEQTQYNE